MAGFPESVPTTGGSDRSGLLFCRLDRTLAPPLGQPGQRLQLHDSPSRSPAELGAPGRTRLFGLCPRSLADSSRDLSGCQGPGRLGWQETRQQTRRRSFHGGTAPRNADPIRERNFGSGVAVGSRPPSEPKARKNASAWRPKLHLPMKFQVSPTPAELPHSRKKLRFPLP